MQWGSVAPALRASEYDYGSIALPIAFPTAALSSGATMWTGDTPGFTDSFAAVKALSTTAIQVYAGSTVSNPWIHGIYWFAIGY